MLVNTLTNEPYCKVLLKILHIFKPCLEGLTQPEPKIKHRFHKH